MAMLLVNPGDSMPIKLIKPGAICFIEKSSGVCEEGCNLGRIPESLQKKESQSLRLRQAKVDFGLQSGAKLSRCTPGR